MYKYSIFETALGYMGAVSSAKGLHMIILPKKNEKEVKRVLEEHYTADLMRDEKALSRLVSEIKDYLLGGKKNIKVNVDASGATHFEIKVWDATYGIPYGEVRSYDWIANQIGAKGKGRAVGQALKRNRLPIVIPCHRVVKKSGDLGGFSGGVELKRKLLKIEGRVW
jgi:methylated-DNA-[protein]-cysteine S-methyltransferase